MVLLTLIIINSLLISYKIIFIFFLTTLKCIQFTTRFMKYVKLLQISGLYFIIGEDKYYVFVNVFKFKEYIVYEYEYDENVELSIYHPTFQSIYLIL